MSNIDKQALREAAEKATPGPWRMALTKFNGITHGKFSFTKEDIIASSPEKRNAIFIAAANPKAVLALLDELEAKDKRLNDILTPNMLLPVVDDMDADNLRHVIKTVSENYSLLHAKWEAADKRIAELEARTAPNAFSVIGENIRTQDNRVTSDPMFCVYQKREIVTHEDYDHSRIVWIDEDGNEATQRQRMRLELLHENFRETPEKWRRVAVKEIDEFVTCCFTEKGCKDYLACNGHNLRLPFIYAKSGFRNAEYIGIRNWLSGIRIQGED
ncbi:MULTISPECIES: ead/Ea22-like family protein [Enterobacter]|uniref:ead/Ea22-like family protein n=1 Tax=Enterobacter TaxID=547 RepID=UPI00048A4069|nr:MULTISPECIES: ead/Ea22-like family protein [Enterobacter cloacae complex]MCD2460420.1 ead/Ea22-like family protein [Enterobacter cloacae complex sp. 2021EL-01261]HDT2074706.1 ead/Ea22-like family protein [Enterobacter roggenkampii]HEG2001760.1 ead/Ea22-like family protein [Enterobacter asburiae]